MILFFILQNMFNVNLNIKVIITKFLLLMENIK